MEPAWTKHMILYRPLTRYAGAGTCQSQLYTLLDMLIQVQLCPSKHQVEATRHVVQDRTLEVLMDVDA